MSNIPLMQNIFRASSFYSNVPIIKLLGKLLFVLFAFCCFPSISLANDITFRSLTPDNGLSQISVNALYQDERGYIWVATREGANCYNGNRIKTYKIEKGTGNSLLSNHIQRIEGNKKGAVYFLCTDGISALDIEKEKFTTIVQATDIAAIHYSEKLYIARNNEIYVYDEASQEVKLFLSLKMIDSPISTMQIDESKQLWVGTTNKGVFLISDLSNPENAKHIIEKGHITSIYQDDDKDIWIGTWTDGYYNFSDGKLKHYTHQANNENSVSSDFVRTFIQDNMGHIWIGTFMGLDKLDKKTGKVLHYSANDKDSGMTHSSVWAMIKDHQGTVWFGTYFGGVNYFNPEYEIYTHYRVAPTPNEGLSSSIIGKMIEDDNNNLWICTEGGGVNVYNRKTGKIKWYTADGTSNSISHNNVKTIYHDADNKTMWIGTHLGGLNKLDLRTNKFTHYKAKAGDPQSLPSDIIRDIVPYKDKLVIATQDGVALFSPATGKSELLFQDTEKGRSIRMVPSVFVDYYGTLWIAATGEGVFSYNFDTKELVNYSFNPNLPNSISNNDINHITQDHNYKLWFSTSGTGLDLFHYDTKTFENFDTRSHGLLSDCIYEVCESRYGKLLLITNQGFGQFDFDNKTFYNYSIDNGFPLSTINENGLYLTHDGEVFLGGVTGMISFYEKKLGFGKKKYNIIPSELHVNGRLVNINDDTGILSSSLYTYPDIVLKDSHSVFNIEFATTNYMPVNKDDIMYKLEGFTNDWTLDNGSHLITYTNLNPGKYTLVIKAANVGTGIVPEARLNITVLPPFYKTIYAYLLYAIVALGIIVFLIRSYNSRIRLQESLKYEQKHLQDVEELNQSKLRFFTSISHEFRTPLTLIIGQMEMLIQLEAFTPNVYNKLLAIYKNSLQMRGLITELLDFRKQDQGHLTLKVSQYDIIKFIDENYVLFLEYSKLKKVNLTLEKPDHSIEMWYDASQLQKVINNLLSNAFKHTQEGDTIAIKVAEQEDTITIDIADTGTGIANKDLELIFTRFYQIDEATSGTGIGLALSKGIAELHQGSITVSSEQGVGTTFSVTLRRGKDHFDAKQIRKEEIIEDVTPLELLNANMQLATDYVDTELAERIQGAKMLIVEDNAELRGMLVKIFEPFYTLVIAADGEEGWQKVKEEMPNIVLSDVLMPKMSGIELCKAIKDDIDTCHIPVVLLTARIAVEQTIEGLHNGADDYVTKPFNVNVLISRCNNLVNSRIVLQEIFGQQPQITPMMLATNRLDKELIDKVMAIVEENISNPEFSIDQLAVDVGIARTNLYSKIKSITGQTPNRFLTTVRLKKAAYLLRNTPEQTIAEIAYETGFSSPRYFSKCFKDMYSYSPLEYRTGGGKYNDDDIDIDMMDDDEEE